MTPRSIQQLSRPPNPTLCTPPAMPGQIGGRTCLEFRGRVSEIAPMAEERHGDIVYKVTIDLEEGLEAGLRWGMTAYVDILVGE